MGLYDNKCRQCDDGMLVKGEDEETCDVCQGYGYLLTVEGHNLIEFLKRRGIAVPMSPQTEDELRGMVE